MPFQLSPAITFQTTPWSLASFTSSIGAGFFIHQFFCWFPCGFFMFLSINKFLKYLWIFEIDVKHRERSQVQDLGSGLCQQLCQHLSHLYLCLSEHPWQLGSCDQRPLDGLKINAAGWNILSIEPVSPKLSGRLATSQHTVSTSHTREDKNNVVCSLFRICHFWTWHKSCTQDPQYCPAHAAINWNFKLSVSASSPKKIKLLEEVICK